MMASDVAHLRAEIVRTVGRPGVDVRVDSARDEVCIDVVVGAIESEAGTVYTVWDVDDWPWVLRQMREHGHASRGR
jgi:hypothetical protein